MEAKEETLFVSNDVLIEAWRDQKGKEPGRKDFEEYASLKAKLSGGQVPNSEKEFVAGFIAAVEDILNKGTQKELAYSLGLLEAGVDAGNWDVAQQIIKRAPHLLDSEVTASGIFGTFIRNPNSGEKQGLEFARFLFTACKDKLPEVERGEFKKVWLENDEEELGNLAQGQSRHQGVDDSTEEERAARVLQIESLSKLDEISPQSRARSMSVDTEAGQESKKAVLEYLLSESGKDFPDQSQEWKDNCLYITSQPFSDLRKNTTIKLGLVAEKLASGDPQGRARMEGYKVILEKFRPLYEEGWKKLNDQGLWKRHNKLFGEGYFASTDKYFEVLEDRINEIKQEKEWSNSLDRVATVIALRNYRKWLGLVGKHRAIK